MEHGQVMGKLERCFIIDEDQQGVQQDDQSSRDAIPAFTPVSFLHRGSQSQ